MTLGRVHEVVLASAVSLACLIALLGGAFSPFAWLALFAPWVSAFLRPRGRQPPALSGTIIAFASLALGVATLVSRGAEAAVLGGGYTLLGLLVARVITRRTLAHDGQALLLSLLLVVAGSVLNLKLSYGVLFFFYGIVVVWALITRELLRGAERNAGGDERRLDALRARRDVVTGQFLVATSAVAAVLLLSTAGLFALFPRVGWASLGGLLTPTDGRLPPSVSLRGTPRGSSGSNAVVARVRGVSWDAFTGGLYLRGPVYDALNEQGFERTRIQNRVFDSRLTQPGPAPTDTTYEVFLNPGAGELLFSLGSVRSARALAGGDPNPSRRIYIRDQNASSELRARRAIRTPMTYRVSGSVAAPAYLPPSRSGGPPPLQERAPSLAEAYLALPEALDPRIAALARARTAAATTDRERAALLRTFLLGEFDYTLEQPNAQKESPLASFLLEDRRGHCEYFATAYAVLLRTLFIPARVVGGYQGGAWDDDANLVVFLERHAHAWVEWYEPGTGWVVDDPTPIPTRPRETLDGWTSLLERLQRFWDDQVIDLSLQDQLEALERASRALDSDAPSEDGGVDWRVVGGAVAGAAALALAVVLWRRRRRRARVSAPEDALLVALVAALERARGAPLDRAATLREAVSTATADDALGSALRSALELYERRRFGGEAVSPEELHRAEQALRPRARGR